MTPDYTVVAVDAPAAEYITTALRAAGTGGTVARLDGFTTTTPPPDGPLQPDTTRPKRRRDPYSMDEMGRVPWDRFQTLCGIQYYFDTEFQLLRGTCMYSGTEWGLSSINQHGFWERRPILDRDGHVSVLSVDIGDFNAPSRHLVDEFGRGKAARDCTARRDRRGGVAPDRHRAHEQRRDPSRRRSPAVARVVRARSRPDHGYRPRSGRGPSGSRNESPYLVPIVGDWTQSARQRPVESARHRPGPPHRPRTGGCEDLEQRNVWQARHGGYQVHNNSVVFAGTWNKTFTRVTSMESACESGRHAVNAILDHYVWVASGGLDRREQDHPRLGVSLRVPRSGSVEPGSAADACG